MLYKHCYIKLKGANFEEFYISLNKTSTISCVTTKKSLQLIKNCIISDIVYNTCTSHDNSPTQSKRIFMRNTAAALRIHVLQLYLCYATYVHFLRCIQQLLIGACEFLSKAICIALPYACLLIILQYACLL